MKKVILGICAVFLTAVTGYGQETKDPLQITIQSDKQVYKVGEKISIRVEFKNVSSQPITLLDFQDYPQGWEASASYFRGMVLGFNQKPMPYHMPTVSIDQYVTLKPGAYYSFNQNYNGDGKFTATSTMKVKMIYDTKIFAESVWKGDYWKGQLESNEIPIVVEKLPSQTSADQKQIENGIYFIADKGPVVKTLDDKEVYLGEKFTEPVEKINFRSVSNDNEGYALTLQKTGPFSKDNNAYFALYVDGYSLRFNGSGSSNNTIFDISGAFESAEAAKVFAQYLKVQPLMRVHPKYALRTTFVPAKKSFSQQEPFLVTLKIRNDGTVPVTFQVGGENRGERDNQFGFTAYDGMKAVPDTGSPVHFGGLSFNKTLKPDETFTKDVDLAKWFSFDKGGTYQITGTYHLSFFDSGDTDRFVVWEDYAAASFYIKIDEAEKAAIVSP